MSRTLQDDTGIELALSLRRQALREGRITRYDLHDQQMSVSRDWSAAKAQFVLFASIWLPILIPVLIARQLGVQPASIGQFWAACPGAVAGFFLTRCAVLPRILPLMASAEREHALSRGRCPACLCRLHALNDDAQRTRCSFCGGNWIVARSDQL